MKVKAGSPVLDVITVAYHADQPVMLEGPAGIGKSQLMAQAAEGLGVDCAVIDLSIIESVDLSGMPQITKGETRYAPPALLPKKGRGLLVLEELNRAPRHVQAPALQLLTARRLNSYALPDGWLPCACINPTGGDYHTDELDAALLSRFMQVEVEPDVLEWQSWAKENGVDQRVIEFVSCTPKIFEVSNPRSWAYVDKVWRTCIKEESSEETTVAAISGLVGTELALALLAFSFGKEEPLEASDVLERFEERQVLETIERWQMSGRLDLLEASVHKLKVAFQASSILVSLADEPEQQKNLEHFLQALPGDLRRKAQGLVAGPKKTRKKKAGR